MLNLPIFQKNDALRKCIGGGERKECAIRTYDIAMQTNWRRDIRKKLRTARCPPSPLPDQTVSPGRTYIDSTLNTSTCGRIRFPTWSPTYKLPFTDFWEMQIGVYDLAGIFRISRRRQCRMIFESFQMSQWPLLSISIRLRAGCPQFPEIRETPRRKTGLHSSWFIFSLSVSRACS